jgi:hypothetical protein
MAGVELAAAVEIMVHWRPPRFRDRSSRHPLVKWSLVLSAQEMSAPAAFEAPAHHSLPFVVRAYVLQYQILGLVTEPQNYCQTVHNGNLGGKAIVLAKESLGELEYLTRSNVDYSQLEVFARRHRSEAKESPTVQVSKWEVLK